MFSLPNTARPSGTGTCGPSGSSRRVGGPAALRVCHVIHNTHVGGAETMLYQLLRRADRSATESAVISLMECGPTGDRIRRAGVPVHALGGVYRGLPNPLALISLVCRLREFAPDVVQTWTYHADLIGGLAAKLAGNLPVVWNIRHGTLDPRIDSRNTLQSARLCARLSKVVPRAIVVNSLAALDVHRRAGYCADNMQVIPNGFDTQRFRPSVAEREAFRAEIGADRSNLLVGMCGRFHPHKGHRDFIAAASRIAAGEPHVRFVLAGEGCCQSNEPLCQWIGQAGLRGRFHLLGCRSDMPRVLAGLDACMLSSITEGMPNIVGEAMACGTPCIVTDVGDAARLVGETGWVAPPRNPSELARQAGHCLGLSAEQRREIGLRARQRIVEHFQIDRVMDRYVEVWQSARRTSGKAPTRPDPRNSSSKAAPRIVPFSSPGSKPKLVHVTTIPMTQWLFLRGQNQFMAHRGFEVHAVSSPGSFMKKLAENEPIVPHEIPMSRSIAPWKDIVSLVRLVKLFRGLRPEIVQVSTPKAALLGAAAAWLTRVPIRVYQIRGLSSESERGLKRRGFRHLEWLTARLCNACFVNAQSLLQYARHSKILRPHEGRVVGGGMSNGVDLQRFDPRKVSIADLADYTSDGKPVKTGCRVIGYVGRLARDKGIEELHAAWQVLREEFPDARLLLVGPWEMENAVSPERRRSLQQDARVIVAGTQDDVAPFYRVMDLFVFPSHGTEGFPNAPMEASAMALPVIATRVIGCVDAVVDGVTGRIVPPKDSEALTDVIRIYLQNTELGRRHGRSGQSRVRAAFQPHRLWQAFYEEHLQLLRSARIDAPGIAEKSRNMPPAVNRRAA